MMSDEPEPIEDPSEQSAEPDDIPELPLLPEPDAEPDAEEPEVVEADFESDAVEVDSILGDSAPVVMESEPPQQESKPVDTTPELQAANVTPEELVAAKWYTMGFLVAIGLLSLVGLAVMIFVAVRMYDTVMN